MYTSYVFIFLFFHLMEKLTNKEQLVLQHDPLVRAARAGELTEPFEALAYAATALAEGVDFNQREPWLSRLKQYREKRCSLDEAFA